MSRAASNQHQEPRTTNLIADIERGIRSTGDTNIGTAARYQARAALRSLAEQYEGAQSRNYALEQKVYELQERERNSKRRES